MGPGARREVCVSASATGRAAQRRSTTVGLKLSMLATGVAALQLHGAQKAEQKLVAGNMQNNSSVMWRRRANEILGMQQLYNHTMDPRGCAEGSRARVLE